MQHRGDGSGRRRRLFRRPPRAGRARGHVRRARPPSGRDARAGLAVKSALGDATTGRAAATDDPATLAPVDVVLLRVKLWDTETAAPRLAAAARARRRGDSVAERRRERRRVGAVLGAERVLGGVAYIAATHRRAGGDRAHRHDGAAAVRRGRRRSSAGGRGVSWPHAATRTSTRRSSPDIRRALWEKFVFLRRAVGRHRRDRASRSA